MCLFCIIIFCLFFLSTKMERRAFCCYHNQLPFKRTIITFRTSVFFFLRLLICCLIKGFLQGFHCFTSRDKSFSRVTGLTGINCAAFLFCLAPFCSLSLFFSKGSHTMALLHLPPNTHAHARAHTHGPRRPLPLLVSPFELIMFRGLLVIGGERAWLIG